ncbi:MAG: 5-oxoprolinase subunit PxpB [Flavobacteriaceae bacterium]
MKEVVFSVTPLHPKAILLNWENKPSDKLLEILLSFREILIKQPDISHCVMGYQSLVIHLIQKINQIPFWEQRLYELYSKRKPQKIEKRAHWKIPVCYQGTHAPDLIQLSDALKIDPYELIRQHTKVQYRVYFIGFLPGFLYLNGLAERLHFPRKEKPQLKVPKGAVGIGGKQTGIYPSTGPGGWHLIGNTPISLFDINQQPPCFAQAGDRISFDPISEKKYQQMQREIKARTFKLNVYD